MTIYNVTFMIDRSAGEKFIDWIRGKGDILLSEDNGVKGARLQEVVEVPGESEFAMQALSIALQVDFPDRESAHAWGHGVLAGTLSEFRGTFGDEALSFATILETISLR